MATNIPDAEKGGVSNLFVGLARACQGLALACQGLALALEFVMPVIMLVIVTLVWTWRPGPSMRRIKKRGRDRAPPVLCLERADLVGGLTKLEPDRGSHRVFGHH
jgi:hypothetical protein